MTDLAELRKNIQELDRQLIELLMQRNELVEAVRLYKKGTNIAVYQPEVQNKKLATALDIASSSKKSFSASDLANWQLILRLIMDLSVSKQLADKELLEQVARSLSNYEQSVIGKLANDDNKD